MRIRNIAVRLAAALMLMSLLVACSGDGGEKPQKTFPYSPGESFLTNIKDEEKKLLKSDITLELSSSKLVTELEAKQHVVRDIITRVLRELSLEDIQKDDVLTTLETRIVEDLNAELGDGTVVRAYFSTFVTAST